MWEREGEGDGNEEDDDDDGKTHVNTETTERTLRTFSIGRSTGCCLMTVEWCSTQQLSYQPDRRRPLHHGRHPVHNRSLSLRFLLSIIIITIITIL